MVLAKVKTNALQFEPKVVIGMAVKTANFNMRMEEQKKADAEALYRTLGMTLPQAGELFSELDAE